MTCPTYLYVNTAMPRVTKSNARQHLQNALELFSKVTGEAIGATFTWNGQVNVFGAEPFKEFASKHKEVWQALISSVHRSGRVNEPLTKPDQDRNDLRLLSEGNFSTLSVPILRKLVVLVTQRSIGKF